MREREPVGQFGRRLLAAGVLSEEQQAVMAAQAREAADDALAFAEAAADPAAPTALDHVYADVRQIDPRAAYRLKGAA